MRSSDNTKKKAHGDARTKKKAHGEQAPRGTYEHKDTEARGDAKNRGQASGAADGARVADKGISHKPRIVEKRSQRKRKLAMR